MGIGRTQLQAGVALEALAQENFVEGRSLHFNSETGAAKISRWGLAWGLTSTEGHI